METLILDWKDLIKTGITDDDVALDWTARAVDNSGIRHWVILAKADGISAIEEGALALQQIGTELSGGHGFQVHLSKKDGETIKKGEVLVRIEGTSQVVLGLERTFLNLAGYVCGIATETSHLVELVRAKNLKNIPRVTHTRKILPGYRNLAIHGVTCGGGSPHRTSLAGGILLKENHIAAAGGIGRAIESCRKHAPHTLKIEIEVRNAAELDQAISAGAEIIMLDNFSVDMIHDAIAKKPKGVLYEFSGGISAQNIQDYAIDGIDILSVGGLTHSVKCLDLSLLDRSLL